jgi:hypothetical protein
MNALDAMGDVEKTSLFGTAVHAVLRVQGVGAGEIESRLRSAGLDVQAIQQVAPSLEDVFLDVVERSGRASAA